MLVAYGNFSLQPPQLLGFGLYGTKTMFLTVLFFGLLSFIITSVGLFAFIGTRSLQSEFMLSLSLSISLSLSLVSAAHCSEKLFTMVCVEVDLLLSENEFLFQNISATLLFKEENGLNSLFHLWYFNVLVYTSSLKVCSPNFILTFRRTSIVLAGSTQFSWCFTKSQDTFISLAILK